MEPSRDGTSRRQVLKGMVVGTASVLMGPIFAITDEENGSRMMKALPRTSPSAVGIDPAAILAFVEAVNKQVGGLHSMMLVRHGKVAAEAWWKPYEPNRPHILFSLSKSFTSTAVGLAVAEKRLTVEDKVISFFPDKVPANPSENLSAMRVKDLLTMSTGHQKEPKLASQDWVKDFLSAPVEHKPGTHFLYNTPATHILAAIVEKLTGEHLMDYLTPRLFKPLGIEGAIWDKAPSGVAIGGYGLSVKTEDIAKFGQLYLQKGKWEGKQLLPEGWIEEATSRQVSNGDPANPNDWAQGYGYQFWRCRHGFYRGDGAFGQFCIVMQEHDAILAITSGVGDMGAIMNAAWTHLLPGFSKGALVADETALAKKLSTVAVPWPKGEAGSPTAAKVSGKTYRLEENEEGVRSIKLTFERDRCTIETTRKDGSSKVVCGTKDWVRGVIRDNLATRPIAAGGAWAAPNRFTIKSCLLDGPFEWNESFVFDGDTLTVEGRALNVSFGPVARSPLKGRIE